MADSEPRNRDPQFPFFEDALPANAAPRRRRSRRPSRRDPLALTQDGYYDPAAIGEYEVAADQTLLRNPYVLAGLAVAGAIVLAVIVVVLFGGSGSTGASGSEEDGEFGVIVDPLTPQPGRGVVARSVAAATIREGPAIEFPEIAPLRANQDVEVAGKNQAGSWYQIYWPSGSQLKGWVASSALRLPEGAGAKLEVVVATPIPRPTIAQPTATAEPAATPVPTATVSPTPLAGPDLGLSIANNSCLPGLPLVVAVRNVGQSKIDNRRIRLTVITANGSTNIADHVLTLDPGGSVTLGAGQAMPPRVGARVDFVDGGAADAQSGNNLIECVPAGGTVPFPPVQPTLPPGFPTPAPGFPTFPTPRVGP